MKWTEDRTSWCKWELGLIEISQTLFDIEIEETIVHEICHILTPSAIDRHGEEWKREMLRIADLAKEKGDTGLALFINKDLLETDKERQGKKEESK